MGVLVVNGFTVALAIRPIVAAKTHAFIGQKPDPTQGVYDVTFRAGHITALVGVFDAQDELATVFARQQIVVQSGAHAADVERARWRGGKTYSDQILIRVGDMVK